MTTVAIFALTRSDGVQQAGQKPASQASDSKSRRLFGREERQARSDRRRPVTGAHASARIASRPPSTPTVPSKRPALGIASMWEPVPTGARSGSSPVQRANVLPTASSRTVSPASRHRSFTYSRPRTSASVKTTRVTTGGASWEIAPSASSSAASRFWSMSSFTAVRDSNLCRSGISRESFRALRTTAGSTAPSR